MEFKNYFKALIVILFTGVQVSQAQTTHCTSDEINDTLYAKDPIFQMNLMQLEEALEVARNISADERSNEVYTLPVVVHIIHKGEPYGTGSNITDEQVFSAITALNNDYRHVAGSNGYGNGPDIGIEFCLAARDPEGQPSNGIVRVDGRSVPLYEQQGIASSGSSGASETAVKALSTWPRTDYVNIWVVTEIENNDGGSGIQGYAYFPVNNPVDGIVILYNAIGTVGNLKSYTNLNRTLTHEMGHYLGLYHTFHATTACGTEGNCNTAGDKICDTPPTIQSGSCSSPACSGTQQVENYMDYTSQLCQNMFTEGQKLRMRTSLENQRTSMLSSMGCMPVNARDVGITAVLSPSGYICPGGVQPTVTLANFGSSTLTSVTINYNIDGVGSYSKSWTGSLAPGATTTATLNTITPSAGEHTLYVWTSNPNGQPDQNTSNDQASGTFNIATGGSATLIVRLDYFGSETTWKITDSSNNLLMNGGPYEDYQQGTEHTHSICLPVGCYTLTFYDTHNDGQGFTNGNFRLLTASGDTLVYQSGNWGQSSANPFCLVGGVSNPPTASMTSSATQICKNATVNFTNTSTGNPTSYSWVFEGGTPATSSAQNPQNITYNTAGTYDVTLTVSNSNGSDTYVCQNCITVYAKPSISLTSENPGCYNASTGSVTSSVSGGSSPYGYSWSNGATSQNLLNVSAGTYTLTVTDAHQCSANASKTLTNPQAISVTGDATNISCYGGNNGSITVSASGGTGSKTFTWSNGASGSTISSLSAGSYTVTATDTKGCTKTQSFTISAPSAITIQGTVTDPTCTNSTGGSISVTASGGTGNKTFTWSNGASGSSISGLGGGQYTVTVTDQNGCTKTQPFTLVSPSAMVINGVSSNPSCAGGSNGVISVSVQGAIGSISYLWSNGVSGNTASGLSAGTYSVTATDGSGCSISQSFTLTSPAAVLPNLSKTDITCNGDAGSAQVNPSGGMGGYQVLWSTGSTSNSITGLTVGSYSVTVMDAFNCSAQTPFTIVENQGLSVSVSFADVSCNGLSNGSATATAQGGSGSYSYVWSNGAGSSTVMGLATGTYGVLVTDSNGCQGSAQAVISQPNTLVIQGETLDASCFGQSNGAIYLTAQGGTGAYQFSYNGTNIGSVLDGIPAGDYTISVSDENECDASAVFHISQPDMLMASFIVISGESCSGNDGAVELTIYGGSGDYDILWSNSSQGYYLEGLAAGNYSVVISDANGCEIQGEIEVPYECEVEIPVTQLIPENCNVDDMPINSLIYCEAVTSASIYQWKFEAQNGEFSTEEYSLGNVFYVSEIPFAANGMKYFVSVRALVEGNWGSYGEVCSLSIFDDTPVGVSTKLDDLSCGIEITNWGQTLTAVEVSEALTYQWHITGINYNWMTYTSSNSLVIEEAMQLVAGETYSTRLRCSFGPGQFTEWGEVCTFSVNLAIGVASYPPVANILHFYPNPCDGQKLIFDFGNLPSGSSVEDLAIYNAGGKLVETMPGLINSGSGNIYEYYFGNQLSSGMYVLQFKFNGTTSEEKLLVR